MRQAALLMSCLALSGCFSSEHVGRDRRKVYMTIQDNQRGYSKNGQFHSEMGFGGGLLDAVGDNPQATQAAEEYRTRAIGGFVALLAGMLCVPSLAAYDLAHEFEEGSGGTPGWHGYVFLGCGLLAVAGGFYLFSAMPYQFDAVNIYNDAIDARSYQWPAPPAAPVPTYQNPPVYQGPPGN